ncbi:response regulator transcription factor [Streptomyces flaveolus]|uniref:response regulator transcription factor n=1 Tax=Streptomyces flaveolus TaxID=67297 RepID=UPI00382FC16E
MEVPLTPPDTPRQDPLSELGARELEVLTQLARGRRNREVAQQLHISEPTVKFHLVKIFDVRVGVRKRFRRGASRRARRFVVLRGRGELGCGACPG